MLTVFTTIGHSTRIVDRVPRTLARAHGIERVVDVRSIPRSRHNPQFNQRDAIREAARRQNQLCPFAHAGRLAPCAARFAQRGLAQHVVSRLRRLHADAGIREGPGEIDQIGEAEEGRDHVRGSGALALPPFAHRRRAHRARDSRSAYCQREARPGSHSDSLWEGSGRTASTYPAFASEGVELPRVRESSRRKRLAQAQTHRSNPSAG